MQQLVAQILSRNNILPETHVQPIVAGQINHVYTVGDDLVLKVERDLGVLAHQRELLELCHQKGAKVPRIVDAGEEEGKQYLLMERLPGRNLAYDWLTLETSTQDRIVAEICEQLRLMHSIHFERYSLQRPTEHERFEDALRWYINFDQISATQLDAQTREHVELLRDFFTTHIERVQEAGTSVLVYNDLHFENVLWDGEHVTGIIDFDFARQAPIDYELWHLIDFLRTPHYFLEEKIEDAWRGRELGHVLTLFRRHYPELFTQPDLLTRVRLYLIEDILGHAAYPSRVEEQVYAYFTSDWLERVFATH